MTENTNRRRYAIIDRCSDPAMWYADQVGCIYRIHKITGHGYWTTTNGGTTNYIKRQDAGLLLEVRDEA